MYNVAKVEPEHVIKPRINGKYPSQIVLVRQFAHTPLGSINLLRCSITWCLVGIHNLLLWIIIRCLPNCSVYVVNILFP
ncbi:hypothetical protein HanXRQr2_Chr09g0400331 [Helianthus annuus]|uniref:Uncharacterized protein n=1 Tax=Helianthus annuus TaxID=4232 RepID=A0A9K3N9G8_HELAN|nr:hypothetical protein HanXRQr2_Chr09g0400331 [Helianthus annuus]KAJ0894174.1 hypothetical protein HanPSC8_Chr09g0386091 [Helianthus annuus]